MIGSVGRILGNYSWHQSSIGFVILKSETIILLAIVSSADSMSFIISDEISRLGPEMLVITI